MESDVFAFEFLFPARPEFFCLQKSIEGWRNQMNGFYVYILKCSDDSYYVGHTDNIEQRISGHQINQFNCYTSTRLPVELVYVQAFGSRDEAFHAERQIKKWSRLKKEALIIGDWSKLSELAKKKF